MHATFLEEVCVLCGHHPPGSLRGEYPPGDLDRLLVPPGDVDGDFLRVPPGLLERPCLDPLLSLLSRLSLLFSRELSRLGVPPSLLGVLTEGAEDLPMCGKSHFLPRVHFPLFQKEQVGLCC